MPLCSGLRLALICLLACLFAPSVTADGGETPYRHAQAVFENNDPSATGAFRGATQLTKADVAVPEILSKTDAVASQRLRFDIGDRVFFSAGSAELGSRARFLLSRQARWLKAWNARIVIAGHADEGGNGEANQQVAWKRAEVVRDRLVEEGISPERVQILGLGRSKPVADCPEPACAVQNRRAVVHVMGVRK